MALDLNDKTKVGISIGLLVASWWMAGQVGAKLNEFKTVSDRTTSLEVSVKGLSDTIISMQHQTEKAKESADRAYGEARAANMALDDIKAGLTRLGAQIPNSTMPGTR